MEAFISKVMVIRLNLFEVPSSNFAGIILPQKSGVESKVSVYKEPALSPFIPPVTGFSQYNEMAYELVSPLLCGMFCRN